eukprot:gene4788-4831_t
MSLLDALDDEARGEFGCVGHGRKRGNKCGVRTRNGIPGRLLFPPCPPRSLQALPRGLGGRGRAPRWGSRQILCLSGDAAGWGGSFILTRNMRTKNAAMQIMNPMPMMLIRP